MRFTQGEVADLEAIFRDTGNTGHDGVGHLCGVTDSSCAGEGAGAEHDGIVRQNVIRLRLRQIAKKAGDRNLTVAQAQTYGQLEAEFNAIASRMGRPTFRDGQLAAGFTGTELGAVLTEIDNRLSVPDWSYDATYRGTDRGEVRVLGPGDRLFRSASPADPGYGITMPQFVRGIVTGDWGDIPPEERVMAVGSGAGGGFLVPTPLALRVIDKARNAARVIQAGALTVPMDASTMKIARVAGDPTAAWKLENAAGSPSDMLLESITFTARTLFALVKASVEVVEDAQQIDNTIEDGLAAALALEVDRVALRGSGTPPEPQGIRNQTGVTIQSMGANGLAYTNYDPLSNAIQAVRANNGEPNAVIHSPRTYGTLDRLKDTTNQPLRPPPSVEGIRTLVTKQIPENLTQGTSTAASESYVGQWNELLLGVRRTITIEASRQAADSSGSAFRDLQVWIRAYLRLDVQLAHPEHFVVVTGVL